MISHSKDNNKEPLDFNKVLTDNVGLVVSIVNSFKPKSSLRDDCIQLGYIGLWKATQIFSPEKGRFSTIAWKCISREVARFLRRELKHKYELLDTIIVKNGIGFHEYLPKCLSSIELAIITMKYQNYTSREIEDALGINNRQKVSRIFKSVKDKIREANV